jgi:hypothetical protein
MPEKETMKRARKDKRQGKAPSTQAGEFVREEMHHVREGKHGARSPEQAIAIGLSKARRAASTCRRRVAGAPKRRRKPRVTKRAGRAMAIESRRERARVRRRAH